MNTPLKTKRENLGFKQVEVANKAKIAIRTYQYYETGRREPGVRTAIRIAKAVNSTVEELFTPQE